MALSLQLSSKRVEFVANQLLVIFNSKSFVYEKFFMSKKVCYKCILMKVCLCNFLVTIWAIF